MQSKGMMWIAIAVGSTLGSLIPEIWGGSLVSISSIFFGGLGAMGGIWVAYNFAP